MLKKFSILILIFLTLIQLETIAQTPEKMSFQAVVRNSQNQLVTNTTIGMQISILQGSENGVTVYSETQSPQSNSNGLVTLQIGAGDVMLGDLSTIDWEDGSFYIKTETDPEGGTDYSLSSTTQILSVPYALHAKTIDYYNEIDPEFEAWDKSSGISITENQISDLDHFTNEDETDPLFSDSPAATITETNISLWNIDNSNSNELQTISKEGSTITLSKGGGSFIDDVDKTNELIDEVSLDGTTLQVIDSAGVHSVDLSTLRTIIHDADNDTKIQVEESADEDVVRIDVAGTETMTLDGSSGTIMRLPTNDTNSSLKVKNANGTTVFGVDGRGLLNGDGSGLSNVKAKLAYGQGNKTVKFHEGAIPGLNAYEAQIMRQATIYCPGPGYVMAHASGYADWESQDVDLIRIWFWPHNVYPYDWETPDKHNLGILSDFGCKDSSDQYSSWALSKVYYINSAQDFTVYICGDKFFDYSKVRVGDPNIQLIYFPTGGVGEVSLKSTSIPEFEASEASNDSSAHRNLDGSIAGEAEKQEETTDPPPLEITKLTNEVNDLKTENELLIKRLTTIEKLLNVRKE